MQSDPKREEPAVETITYQRRKEPGQREAKLQALPVEVIEYHLPAEEQVCPCCTGLLHTKSTEVHQELKVIPAEVKVVKHVRHIYTCRKCEREAIGTPGSERFWVRVHSGTLGLVFAQNVNTGTFDCVLIWDLETKSP
ncbi:MAG: IS66 family transposase zinc-finger binding domain-containing protein [Bacillota bacterium]